MKLDGEVHAARGPGWEDRRDEGVETRRRFELRAGQWALLALARRIFGPATAARLHPGGRAQPPFGGIVTFTVPFHTLEDHRAREGVFLALASADPVASSTRFLLVFEPDPALPGPPRSLVRDPASTPPPPVTTHA